MDIAVYGPESELDPLAYLLAGDDSSRFVLSAIHSSYGGEPTPCVEANAYPDRGGRFAVLDEHLNMEFEVPRSSETYADRFRQRLVFATPGS